MVGTPISRRKRRASSSEESTRDYASPSPDAQQRSSSKQQIRHRASVACASCRERRIRCVVPEGHAECTQCSRTGTTCIIKNDDERRRPISKAYMSSLSSRIALLEGMLLEQGVEPPPAVHPPKTRQEALERQEEEQNASRRELDRRESSQPRPGTRHAMTPPSSGEEDDLRKLKQEESVASITDTTPMCLIEPSLLQDLEPQQDGNVRHLLSSKGRLSCDHSAARVRFFGPTANVHVYAESSCHFNPREPPEQTRRVEQAIRALSPSTHDHLMSSFWEHFNATRQVVDQAIFEADRVCQEPKFYSAFLHISMLAAGYRFADKGRDDVRKLALGNWESTLHREAKSVMNLELERLGEVPSVQALIILADLECAVGRDTQGWMLSGMASRLAFDIGLHVNLRDTSETERRVRRQVMAACVMLDRHLAAFLGRPTSIKSQDIGINLTPKDLSILSMESAMFGLPEFDSKPALLTDATIHPYMLELVELASSITDSQNMYQITIDTSAGQTEGSRYMQTVAMDRRLQDWYRSLPSFLAWTPVNVKSAPLSFFFLHQTFHTAMILLHRPWAKYGPAQDEASIPGTFAASVAAFSKHFGAMQPGLDDTKVTMARNMCTQHAIRIARIFWQHRQRYDGKKIGLMAAQHAGTAALALMGALAHQNKELDPQSNLRYLQVLSSSIYDMSQTYHPAARMYHLLKSMLMDIRKEMVSSRNTESNALLQQLQQSVTSMSYQPSYPWASSTGNTGGMYPALPVIQESLEVSDAQPVKKRRLSDRRPSELEPQFQPIFFAEGSYDYPSPPNSSKSIAESNAEKPDASPPGVSAPSSDPLSFDFDFFNAPSAEFETEQADTLEAAVDGSVDAPAEPEVDAIAQETIEVVSPAKQAGAEKEAPAQEDEADVTIEEWLSEPRGVTPSQPAPQSEKSSLADSINVFGDKPATDGIASSGSASGPGPQSDGDNMQWLLDMDSAADTPQADISLRDLVGDVVQEKRQVRNLDLDFLRL